MIKGGDLLNSDLLPRRLVDGGAAQLSAQLANGRLGRDQNLPDNTVGALADDILNIILLAYVERDFTGTAPVLCVAHGGPRSNRRM